VLRLPLLSDVYLCCLGSSNIINRKTLLHASKGYVCEIGYVAFPCRDIRPVEFRQAAMATGPCQHLHQLNARIEIPGQTLCPDLNIKPGTKLQLLGRLSVLVTLVQFVQI
jgi:hypothetical protein